MISTRFLLITGQSTWPIFWSALGFPAIEFYWEYHFHVVIVSVTTLIDLFSFLEHFVAIQKLCFVLITHLEGLCIFFLSIEKPKGCYGDDFWREWESWEISGIISMAQCAWEWMGKGKQKDILVTEKRRHKNCWIAESYGNKEKVMTKVVIFRLWSSPKGVNVSMAHSLIIMETDRNTDLGILVHDLSQ